MKFLKKPLQQPFAYIAWLSLIFGFFCNACTPIEDNKELPPEPVVPQEPRFQYSKEKEYLFEARLYSDVIKFFKYNTKVTQTNPNVSVSDEVLKHMADSVNNELSFPISRNPNEAIINDIGYEINDNAFDKFSLSFEAYNIQPGETLTQDKYVTKKYTIHGRDSIITLFNRQNVSGHFTTFDDRPTTFRPVIDIDFRNKLVGLETGDDAFFSFVDKENDYSADIQVPADASFKIPTVPQKPDIFINEHALAYDRFNERTYVAEDGTQYKTIVTVKKLEEIQDFDKTAPTTNKPDFSKKYPVMQFYINGNLWLETLICKYTEEFEYYRETDKTHTFLGFDCYTLKEGYEYWITYGSYNYHKGLEVYVNDFSKPNPGVEERKIKIISDHKEGAKETASVE